jgi:hypothetical protein
VPPTSGIYTIIVSVEKLEATANANDDNYFSLIVAWK